MLVFKMSDEQTSDNQAPVVLVEQDANRSTKESLYRNKEPKDVADTHKDTDPVSLSVVIGQKDTEDDKKGTVLNNLPTNFKKMLETIELSSFSTDKRTGAVIPPTYPTPAKVPSINSSDAEYGKTYQQSEDDDFIVETVPKGVTEDVKDKHSEWGSSSQDVKKKEVSWNERKRQDFWDVDLNIPSTTAEHKPSVKHFHRPTTFGSSGISINIPKKSSRCVNQRSGININISKKSLSASSRSNSRKEPIAIAAQKNSVVEYRLQKLQFFAVIKNKFCNFHKKMKNTLHV